MKYHRIHIDTKDDKELYDHVSRILKVEPTIISDKEDDDELYSLWTFSVEEEDDAPYFDFINNFLDIIEPNLSKLKQKGIYQQDISFWLLYEYDQQCGMEFHPKEMKRLGDSGIVFCIDCWQK